MKKEKINIEQNKKNQEDDFQLKQTKVEKNKRLTSAIKNASSGILTASQSERNIKIQFFIVVVALILGILFNLTEVEIVLVVLAIFFVVFAEMINTAIEAVVDLYVDVYHPKAKVAKDVAAGAVVIATLNAIIVAYFVFFEKLATFGFKKIANIAVRNPTVFFIALMVITIIIVIIVKLISKKLFDNKFIPSGQMMVATSIFMAIWSQTQNKIIIVASLILLMLLALNRIGEEKRTIWEVIFGTVIGFIVALAMYTILKIII